MGRPGREAVRRFVPEVAGEHGVDFVVANAENAAGGRGLTSSVAEELFASGVHAVTMGNHTWDRPEIESLLSQDRVIRPANYPPSLSGHGHAVFHVQGRRLGVLQVMGRHNMAAIDCPFRTADAILSSMEADVIVADLHAEASSEKQALGWYLDGRVAAAVGTHTHVQTADERVLPGGTAFIGDIGMTGPLNGIIGGVREQAMKRFLTGLPVRIEVAEGPAVFCAVVVEADPATGKSTGVRRIRKILDR